MPVVCHAAFLLAVSPSACAFVGFIAVFDVRQASLVDDVLVCLPRASLQALFEVGHLCVLFGSQIWWCAVCHDDVAVRLFASSV